MFVVPAELDERRQAYCEARGIQTLELIGYGLDGYVWKTNRASVVKVCRHSNLFDRELAVYQLLTQLGLQQLQGFTIPQLLHHDDQTWTLELSLVAPPFVLDFAAASLGKAPSEMSSPEWLPEKQRMFGRDCPTSNGCSTACGSMESTSPMCISETSASESDANIAHSRRKDVREEESFQIKLLSQHPTCTVPP